MKKPLITVRGIHGAIPAGYVVGRTDPGTGAIHLIPLSALAQKLGGSGGGLVTQTQLQTTTKTINTIINSISRGLDGLDGEEGPAGPPGPPGPTGPQGIPGTGGGSTTIGPPGADGEGGDNDYAYSIPPGQPTSGRTVLTSNTTYYVRTDGSDTNNGLANTAGGGFLTAQHAWDTVCNSIDLGGFDITLQFAAGTYAGNLTTYARPVGQGEVTFLGNTTTPTNVIITGAWDFEHGGRVHLQGFKFHSGALVQVVAKAGTHILLDGNFELGGTSTVTRQIWANRGGLIDILADFSVTAGISVGSLFYFDQNSILVCPSHTVTFKGNVTYNVATCIGGLCGTSVLSGNTFSIGAFTITGQRYIASNNAILNTGGGGASYFPGTVAGTTDGGGVYV